MWLSNDSKTNALIEPRTVKHSSCNIRLRCCRWERATASLCFCAYISLIHIVFCCGPQNWITADCVVGLHRLGGRWWMQWSCWRTHWLPVESRLKWDSFDFDMAYNNQRYLNCPFLCDHDWCWNSYGMKWSFLLPGQLNIHVCAQGKWCIREVVSPERLQAEVCCKTVELQLAVKEGNMCSKWQQQLKMRANELNVATTKKTF